jgi:hypothetical protein
MTIGKGENPLNFKLIFEVNKVLGLHSLVIFVRAESVIHDVVAAGNSLENTLFGLGSLGYHNFWRDLYLPSKTVDL